MSDDEIVLLPLGAIIQTFKVDGTNIVQNFPTADLYKQHNGPYFGETIGRVANRIGGAKLNLNGGKAYALATNNGPNNLHGGDVGWGKKEWAGPTPVGTRQIPGLDGQLDGGESVKFTLRSADGEEGFPGELDVSVVYTSGRQTVNGKQATVLAMEYEAELVGDAVDETVINMTNHSYV